MEQKFVDWLKEHGSTGIWVKTNNGGRQFLAAGEVAPYAPKTINDVVKSGHATQDGRRVTLRAVA